jgi:hypothetical protein
VRRLVYWHSGGAVLSASGQALSRADVEALLGLHLDEARAARTPARCAPASARAAMRLN